MLSKIQSQVEAAIVHRDLVALDQFIIPTTRKINKRADYHAPLMLSAHKVKHLNKIPVLQSDAVILNLEDGVSVEMKPFALRMVMISLSTLIESEKKIIVRVNALDEGGVEEIQALNPFRPDAIRVPKIKTAQDVQKALDLCDGEIEVHLSIETKEAWLHLASLKVNDRVKAFYLGILDLFADMSLSQELISVDNPLIQQILAQFILTTKALGVKPISFVFQEYQDHEGFQKWLDLEKQMGFEAKGCLSPKQALQAIASFGASRDSIERAQYIVKVFEAQRAEGITGFSDEQYGFIDEPIYKGAKSLLEKEN